MFGLRSTLALAIAVVLGVGLLSAPAAAAPVLRGGWAPLNRCPVDNASMLAATGTTTVASCVAADAASGSITLGGTTLATGSTNLQFGLVNTGGTFAIVPPADGAIISAPVTIPGGILGLMCPSNIPFVSQICEAVENGALNEITATVRAAGAPTEFSLTAGLGVGQPILRLPVKIHLQNPFLGSNCFIGTNANPRGHPVQPRRHAQPRWGRRLCDHHRQPGRQHLRRPGRQRLWPVRAPRRHRQRSPRTPIPGRPQQPDPQQLHHPLRWRVLHPGQLRAHPGPPTVDGLARGDSAVKRATHPF